MRVNAVALHLVPGTPETGLWCEICLLPSRYEVALYALVGDSAPIHVGTFHGCDGHQA
ncbi:Uncharacterised protein [Mycobacteroides abscessus subsp. abscessus]|uniref:Uncharacterized protein n=1 Tax=Mycobacteroides abscessus subsp. massiliense TaxID=1962118 RepID=A0A1T8H5L9_9MYCO|nr:hypothetical protein [Mycobacteroides abscessus]MBE5500471.1 hypothetical protein [Mycobacteroides abscessus]MBE5514365.1 hypothetical protein [Mycobacteroides abscessus]SHT89824.1 Uncharacterised protein [Mycobacteroides abscessus subsp. abscessus]SHY40740.1 Uncharacterised protein [Mycobacteroides abscessus subsp. abscessus]SIB47747.1 Uncharacterised protein [Mycobacteroides abscessus subsp. abscessus]